MHIATTPSLIALFLFSLVKAPPAAPVEISGRVVDTSGAPLPHVSVSLAQAGISTSTDSDGRFVLASAAGVVRVPPRVAPAFSLHGTRIVLPELGRPAGLRFTAFTLHGRRLVDVRVPVGPGTSRLLDPFALAGMRGSSQVLLLRLVLGPHRSDFVASSPGWLRPVSRSMDSRGSRTAAGAAHECGDTLILSRERFLRKRVAPVACSGAVGDIVLYDSTLDLTSASYPLVDGSTSAQPLALVVAASLLGTSYGFVENTDGSRRMVAYSTAKPALADSINSIIIQHNGTHGAHVGVIEGDVDLALVARSPSPDELALADSLGVELRVEPVGLDAFVFITHERNPVDSLTLDQARGIYTGATTTWESLGGPDLPINPYQRERNSGSQELMQSLVMGDLAPIEAPDMIVFTMMGPYNALAGDTAGICYTVYFYGRHMAPADNIKFMALEGVFPEYETIASRSYCLTTEVYLLSRADLDPFTTAAHLRDWLLAPEGQGVVKESGYVPIEEL